MTSKAIVAIVAAASIYFSITSISSGAPVSGAGVIGAGRPTHSCRTPECSASIAAQEDFYTGDPVGEECPLDPGSIVDIVDASSTGVAVGGDWFASGY